MLDKARECINNNLFELQTANDEHDKELLQGCMMILGCIQEDERIRNTAINQINSTLDKVTTYIYVRMYVHRLLQQTLA